MDHGTRRLGLLFALLVAAQAAAAAVHSVHHLGEHDARRHHERVHSDCPFLAAGAQHSDALLAARAPVHLAPIALSPDPPAAAHPESFRRRGADSRAPPLAPLPA